MSDAPSAARLAHIVESAEDAIVSHDLDGLVQTWNRAAERMFGYTAAEAIGQPIAILIPPDRLAEHVDVLARLRRGEAVSHYETWRVRQDGTRMPVSVAVSPLADADGSLTGVSTIARDIRERFATHAALLDAEARQRDLQQRLVSLVAACRRSSSSRGR